MKLEHLNWRHRDGSSAIHLAEGAFEALLGRSDVQGAAGIVCLVDRTVLEIHRAYIERVVKALPQAQWIEIPSGEAAKSFAQLETTLEAFAERRLGRDGLVVGIGGGACTDVAGLAASLWMRGVRWIAVPTTLLAMVDASVGGKTAINLRAAKNLIGAFHAPHCVAVDLRFLSTNPPRELRSGMAEVIKAAMLRADGAFAALEGLRSDLLLDAAEWKAVIAAAIELKIEIVERDEREAGPRRALNLGHTLAHALELASGYGELRHGEAVAIGLVAACDFAVARGMLPLADRARVVALLQRFHLPTAAPPEIPISAVVRALDLDKKVRDGRLRYVLPLGIPAPRNGEVAFVDDLCADEVERWLQSSISSSNSCSS